MRFLTGFNFTDKSCPIDSDQNSPPDFMLININHGNEMIIKALKPV